MYNHWLYFFYWLVSFAVFYLIHWFFPGDFVLGNWKFSSLEAAIYASFWLVFFVWIIWDFWIIRKVKFQGGWATFLYFWMVNAVGIWLVARFSQVLGLGIRNYQWAIGVAFFVNVAQRLAWKLVTKRNLK